MIGRMFLPFQVTTWLLIAAFIVVVSLVMVAVDWRNEEDYGDDATVTLPNVGQRAAQALGSGLMGLFAGAWEGSTQSAPARVVSGGFLFFVFIAMSLCE